MSTQLIKTKLSWNWLSPPLTSPLMQHNSFLRNLLPLYIYWFLLWFYCIFNHWCFAVLFILFSVLWKGKKFWYTVMYLHRESDILASGKLVSLINSCEFLPKNLNFLKFLNLAFIIFLTSCWCYSLIPAKSPTLNCPLQLVTSTCLYLKLLFCCV